MERQERRRRQSMDGKISRLMSDKGFGFIMGSDGQEYFVHRSAIRGEVFEQLREGQPVTFDAREGDKGPRAENVRVVGGIDATGSSRGRTAATVLERRGLG